MMVKKIKISEMCNLIGGKTKRSWLCQSLNLKPSPITDAKNNSISFCVKDFLPDALPIIQNSKARVIICSNKLVFSEEKFGDKIIIRTSNPRLAFIKIMKRYFKEKQNYGISSSALIDKDAKIQQNVYVGHNTYIGKSKIDTGTIIHENVTIYSNVIIGKNVVIKSGAVIGGDGFGYERNEYGELLKFPNVGGVIIENDVEIGSNTCIDRGTLDNTFIGKGTKIDNLCHIAHNVIVGKHCYLIAQCMIGGSVVIGDNSWIAPSACIRDGINIGHNSIVGLGAVVIKDVAENSVVIGVPAKPIRENPIPNIFKKKEGKK